MWPLLRTQESNTRLTPSLSDDRPNKKTTMDVTDNQMTCEKRSEQCLELLRDRKQSAKCIIDKNAKVMNEIGVESTRK